MARKTVAGHAQDKNQKQASTIDLTQSATAGKTYFVSQSKVQSWRTCRQQYHYAYNENLVPKKPQRPFMFGTIVHDMLKADAMGQDAWAVYDQATAINERVFKEEEEMYGRIADDIAYIMEEYFNFTSPLHHIPVNGKYAEQEFEVPLVSDEIRLKGRIDGAVSDKRLKWLLEHKTHKTFPAPENRWRNMQSVIYINVAKVHWNLKLDGTCWDYIRSKPPTRPQITKKGILSEREIDTLPNVIEEVIRHNKLMTTGATLIAQAKQNRTNYFQRYYTPISPEITGHVMDDFKNTAVEMSVIGAKHKQRNMGRHCDWCKYNKLCAAELQGMDVDFVKEREYQVDEATAQAPVREIED